MEKNEYQAFLYMLQSAAREIANEHRVCACCRTSIPGKSVEVWANAKLQRARFHNVMRCADVWVCPVCANHITASRRDDLRFAVKNLRPKSILMMVSFTVRHHRHESLHDTTKILLDAWRGMTQCRAWDNERNGMFGHVRALEVTWGDENGWHPHLHVLFAWLPGTDVFAAYMRMRQAWDKAVTAAGGDSDINVATRYTFDFQDIDLYLAKWGIPEEMTRGAMSKQQRDGGMTPFQLLDYYVEAAGKKEYEPGRSPAQLGSLFREYMRVFRGKRQLTWSRTPDFRKEAGLKEEKTDAQVVIEAPGAGYVMLARLTTCQWSAVVAQGLRGSLLDKAAIGDIGGMEELLLKAELNSTK